MHGSLPVCLLASNAGPASSIYTPVARSEVEPVQQLFEYVP